MCLALEHAADARESGREKECLVQAGLVLVALDDCRLRGYIRRPMVNAGAPGLLQTAHFGQEVRKLYYPLELEARSKMMTSVMRMRSAPSSFPRSVGTGAFRRSASLLFSILESK